MSRAARAAEPIESPGETPAYARSQGIDRGLLEKALQRLEFLYAEVARTWPGFIARPGQQQMMHAALLTFLCAKAPDDDNRLGSNLAQLEAGTGTGKTVAYCLAAIVASELLQKTVVVSTATVALQEQLFHKDLPRLAKIIPELRFDMLKGRGRYLCESRLHGALYDDAQGSLLGDEFQDVRGRASSAPRDRALAMRWFKTVAKTLHAGKWDGDVDTLERQPDPEDWRQVQANAQACNGGQCEYFKSCAFFRARRRAASATIQVANHALILATLQTDSRTGRTARGDEAGAMGRPRCAHRHRPGRDHGVRYPVDHDALRAGHLGGPAGISGREGGRLEALRAVPRRGAHPLLTPYCVARLIKETPCPASTSPKRSSPPRSPKA